MFLIVQISVIVRLCAEKRPAGRAEGPRVEQRGFLRRRALLHRLCHRHHLLNGN